MIVRAVAAALPVALAALVAAALAVVAARLRIVPSLGAFAVFNLSLLGGGAFALIWGAAGVFGVGGPDAALRSSSRRAAAMGLAYLVGLAGLAAGARGAPAIHDLTTDVGDPPAFVAAVASPANRGRDLTYPNGSPDSARIQRRAYPDLVPIDVGLGPAAAYRAALDAATALGWTIVAGDTDAGIFEAEAESTVFRFIDDVVVRVRPAPDGSVVDVRSTSRVGVGDMGANARRIRRFRSSMPTDR